MSKARILADLISDSQITASEITGLELNAIQEGDTIVEVSDDGSGGKVVVRVDGADNAEFNAGGIKIPSGTTAQRDPNAALGSLRYNTTIGFFETFTSSGWGAIATPPSITSITPSNFNGEAGGTFTVDGAFFDADTTAVFKGADGTEYAAATVTFVNSTQITVTNATNLPVANEPFKVKVTNGAGLSVESVSTVDAGTVPAFTTAAGSLASTAWTDPISVTVNATDAENTITGYSVTEGNLPAGLSLNATTGAITGTSTAQATTTYTFTIGATDSAGNTNTRQFSIQIVNAPPVWNSPAEGSTQELAQGTAGSITLSATDPEGESVSYSAGILPTGLSISGNLITGTPTVEANTSVSVNASDGFASSVRNFFINVKAPPNLIGGTATQATIDGVDYKIHTFYSSANLEIEVAPDQLDVLLVAGGGGSGWDMSGGGGGGGVVTVYNATAAAGMYNMTVGAGGLAYRADNGFSSNKLTPEITNGRNTVAFGYTAIGGGAGGSRDQGATTGVDGGSGGGASTGTGGVDASLQDVFGGDALQNASVTGSLGVAGTGYGNRGGNANNGDGGAYPTGGGGGAGQAGQDRLSLDEMTGGNGGDGIQINFDGNNYYWGGGGGGYAGLTTGAAGGYGGLGGGGGAASDGSNNSVGLGGTGGINVGGTPLYADGPPPGHPNYYGGAGGANTGGGGGGGWNANGAGAGGNGGSGIIMVRYRI